EQSIPGRCAEVRMIGADARIEVGDDDIAAAGRGIPSRRCVNSRWLDVLLIPLVHIQRIVRYRMRITSLVRLRVFHGGVRSETRQGGGERLTGKGHDVQRMQPGRYLPRLQQCEVDARRKTLNGVG